MFGDFIKVGRTFYNARFIESIGRHRDGTPAIRLRPEATRPMIDLTTEQARPLVDWLGATAIRIDGPPAEWDGGG